MQIFILIVLFQQFPSQWLPEDSYLKSNVIYQQAISNDAYKCTGNFFKPLTQYTTANFISCSSPATSYITLNQENLQVQNYDQLNYQIGYVISYDLYFHGTWNNHFVKINIGSFSETNYYTSPNSYSLISGFCDSMPYEVQTFNFSLINSYSGKMSFESSNNIGGMVSIRNIVVTKLKCYPSCKTCDGPGINQCKSCYYGTISGNICPLCPINQYYVKFVGCRDLCDFDSKLFKNGFCQDYPGNIQYYKVYYFQKTKFQNNEQNVENLKWQINYDKNHIDTTLGLKFYANIFSYGIFKYKSGIQRFVDEIQPDIGTKLIGLKIVILIFGLFPMEGGINFQLNTTYYGSIFKISSEIQTHNIQIFDVTSLGKYLSYSDCYKYELHMFVDIPQYPFLFSSFSNFTDDSAGWGLVSIAVSSGYCPENCQECDVSFQCKICKQNYKLYRDGKCIQWCYQTYQKQNNTHCIDFDDETPYSNFLVKEYENLANDLTQRNQYIILSQSSLPNVNFLKGVSILYSYWNTSWKNCRVFGGPYVWAQAKFKRVHQIQDPHHSITIGFEILFGPNFPLTGSFIYTIESNPSVTVQTLNFQQQNDDGTKSKRVYEKINHNSNSLDMFWECSGIDNEPVTSYCAFYNYYIAVHYCQPFCLQCTDQHTCTQWNSTYDSSVIKFSQSECLGNLYYSRNEVKCLTCPSSCTSCTSPIDCQGCLVTYTLTKLGCVCKQNQYEDLNQCHDCPTLCTQCLNTNYCIECFLTDFREQVNGQCVCMQGYYPQISNSICLQCHIFCKTCTGPSYTDCLICSDISGIEQNGNTCNCPDKTFYDEFSNSCINCHQTCLVCDTGGKRCLQCDVGYEIYDYICYSICGDQIVTIDEECDDGNLIIGDGCHFCQYSCQDSCQDCIKGKCLNCLDNYELVLSTCQLQCEKQITIPQEQCDYILFSNDGCYQCFQCSENCEICQNGICTICQTNFELDNIYNNCIPIKKTKFDLEINCVQMKDNQCLTQNQEFIDFITNPDLEFDICPQNCKICKFNNCIECKQGYYGQKCISKCGDNIITSQEECDEGKGRLLNQCSNCKLVCPDFCKLCVFGICQECQSGFYLDIVSNTCYSICGDNILASNEVCDDGNDIEYDGCFQCQYQCEIECADCQFAQCVQCLEPFFLVQSKLKCESLQSCEAQDGFYYESFSNSCVNLCGDGIVAGNEECDDSNMIPYDGCNECKFQCSQPCKLCDKGVCLIESCPIGAILMNNSCCGDAILNGDEECDDGNNIDFDGCSNCFYQCNEFCSVCLEGKCIKCIQGYALDQNDCIENENNLTESLQFNHLHQNQNEICRNNECAFSLKPQMRLLLLNQTFSHQYVEIKFDQQVLFADLHDEKQFQTFEILITNLNEQYYNIQLNTIVGITQDLKDAQYIIDIEIFQELQEKPILQVYLIQNVVNSNNQTIIQPLQSILLNPPRILSEELKSKVIAMSQTNKAFMISAISISVFSLIFGEASLFIETLSTLQYQSYLKFINLDYPENLYIYFQTSEMLSLSNYLQSLQIEYILGVITRKGENQISTTGKFALYDVDCDLILNLIPQMFQLFILLTIIFKSKKIYVMYQNLFSTMFSQYYLQNPLSVNQRSLQFCLNFGLQIKKILKFRHSFSLRLIMPICSLNAWDILFKLLLQIHFNKRQNLRELLQYICSLSILTFYFTILLLSYNKSILRNLYFNKKESFQIRYATLNIFRTFLFHIVIVFFQNQQIIQSLLIAINSILHCFFIQKYQQVNKLDKFVNIFTEATVALFSLTTYVYYKENLFTYQTILQFGFFHMGILMLNLALVFCKQIFKKIIILSSKVIKCEKNKNTKRHEIFC